VEAEILSGGLFYWGPGKYVKEGCGNGHLSQWGFCEGNLQGGGGFFTGDPDEHVKERSGRSISLHEDPVGEPRGGLI